MGRWMERCKRKKVGKMKQRHGNERKKKEGKTRTVKSQELE